MSDSNAFRTVWLSAKIFKYLSGAEVYNYDIGLEYQCIEEPRAIDNLYLGT